MKKFLAILAIFGLLFISCSDDDTPIDQIPEEPDLVNYTSGSADFSNYVAVGNSLTASNTNQQTNQFRTISAIPKVVNAPLKCGSQQNTTR